MRYLKHLIAICVYIVGGCILLLLMLFEFITEDKNSVTQRNPDKVIHNSGTE